ncbi:MBL fold metallo-hydrolase [Pseudoflavonifractor sp. 524-17]|uniref:MBL fold metallo-hydrolase n=1 Tax=Pseudoflavonifractor sp. 524-17 TaxID=2304577 RepID=UPI001379DAB0|nr:MBL fold metallo-hydrolase [Pseudoflavonifractor sp. 524-17]NCE65938.1 MBL fold metallo-hydrolase [Pseudoflavonifractor sp. 524-17]
MLTLTTLASGSSGNCALASCGGTHILLDAGISAKRITAGLRALGVEPRELSAVLLTHEHSDHVSGLRVLTKKTGAPIYATAPTCQALRRKHAFDGLDGLLQEQKAGTGVQIGALWVESFPTPHDAAGSVGYSIAGDGGRMVLCTDLGHITDPVRQAVAGCDLLVCETNHDVEWVRSGPYPYYLKQRILGEQGHLSNEAGAELAAWAVASGTKTVVLAHLSQQNNTPARAYATVRLRLTAMDCDLERDVRLAVAPRDAVSPTWKLKGVAVC